MRFYPLLCLAALLAAGSTAAAQSPSAQSLPDQSLSAQSLSANGVAGYLSEWQLSATLSPTPTAGKFTGPLNIKHVGLCTHDGPDEITTQIDLRIIDVKAWFAKAKPEIKATFVMNGSACTLTGSFSGTYRGSMDCADAKGIPVEFSIK